MDMRGIATGSVATRSVGGRSDPASGRRATATSRRPSAPRRTSRGRPGVDGLGDDRRGPARRPEPRPRAAISRENASGMSPSLAATVDPTSLASDPTASPFIDPRGEAPIRAELYGLDRLEALARRLASAGGRRPGAEGGRPPAPPVRRERPGPGQDPPPDRRRGRPPRGAGDRRRVAGRQLPHRRGRPPRDQAGPAQRLLLRAAQARRRPGPGLPPGLHPGPGPGGPHRQRAGRAADHPVPPGLPVGRPADDRRALGRADDAPAGPGREPPAPGRADGPELGRVAAGPTPGSSSTSPPRPSRRPRPSREPARPAEAVPLPRA